jgi:hypothetical protein
VADVAEVSGRVEVEWHTQPVFGSKQMDKSGLPSSMILAGLRRMSPSGAFRMYGRLLKSLTRKGDIESTENIQRGCQAILWRQST